LILRQEEMPTSIIHFYYRLDSISQVPTYNQSQARVGSIR